MQVAIVRQIARLRKTEFPSLSFGNNQINTKRTVVTTPAIF